MRKDNKKTTLLVATKNDKLRNISIVNKLNSPEIKDQKGSKSSISNKVLLDIQPIKIFEFPNKKYKLSYI